MYHYFVSYFYTKTVEEKTTFGFGNVEVINESEVESMEQVRALEKGISEREDITVTIQGVTLLRYEDAVQ